jgi:hypothetical protein
VAADKAIADHIQMQLGLQADCLAGIWANRENEMLKSEGKPVFIEPVDVEAALRIYAVPESPTQGTWERRQRWFNSGLRSGSIQSCNTFAATPAVEHYAQSAPMFTNKDIPNIVETSRSNEIRFNRDYKGKMFSDVLPFTRASETWLGGGYRVGFGSKGMGGGGVDCQISDPKVLNEVVEWNPGLMVSVTGRIKTTSMGDLQLENCDLVVKWNAPFRHFAVDGGLASYGPDQVDQYRRAAGYVDRILRGANPADLPVQAPTKYELVINRKTAKTLGFDVPPTLLARADEVIEWWGGWPPCGIEVPNWRLEESPGAGAIHERDWSA